MLGQVTKLDYEYYINVKFPKAGNCTTGDYVREYPYFLGNAHWMEWIKKTQSETENVNDKAKGL